MRLDRHAFESSPLTVTTFLSFTPDRDVLALPLMSSVIKRPPMEECGQGCFSPRRRQACNDAMSMTNRYLTSLFSIRS